MSDGDGYRHRSLVRDRDAQLFELKHLRATRGASVEMDLRRAGPVRQDLDLPPTDPADAEPQDLADRLLGCPSARDTLNLRTAVARLGLGEHPTSKPIGKTVQHGHDALDLDQVHAKVVSTHSTVTDFARLRG